MQNAECTVQNAVESSGTKAKVRPIDGNVLLEKMQYRLPVDNDISEAVSNCARISRNLVERMPTLDVVPVVHGRWIPLEYDGFADGNPVWDLWECSECQEEHSGDEDTLTPYCPNCGAKMGGDGK